jgi:glycosyltransferase involved in cell wall biosynthesis
MKRLKMRCPNLKELPPAPEGKTGWPWTVESSEFVIHQITEWLRICIVTPSFNQDEFLEETIRSILLQGYPNLEYIVMDGGSTDHSVDIIKKYSPWLAHWESAKDKGQADAIYRGFEKTSADYIGWVNSDDMLLPNAMVQFSNYFIKHPEAELVVGGGITIDNKNRIKPTKWGMIDYYYTGRRVSFSRILIMEGFNFLQPASLWKKDTFFAVGGFDRSLEFCFDLDMYLRLTKRKAGNVVSLPVAAFRTHPATKTSRLQHVRLAEMKQVLSRHGLANYSDWVRSVLAVSYRFAGIVNHKIALINRVLRPENKDVLPRLATFDRLTVLKQTEIDTQKSECPDISVAVCTYKRPELLGNCIKHLLRQTSKRRFEIVVVDNDADESAQSIIVACERKAKECNIPLRYLVEPEQNIALARNLAVSACRGKYVAFIDDDEYPSPDWLEKLVNVLETHNADGVFGPVYPIFSDSFPDWMKNSPLFKRADRPTGVRITGGSAATNNALVKKQLLESRRGPFDKKFGRTGGEDTNLFSWLARNGYLLIWCNDAVVHEFQEEKRISATWHIKRNYRGGWCFAQQCSSHFGRFYGFIHVCIRIPFALIKTTLRLFLNPCNPKALLLIFLNSLAGQAGKIGFFFDFRMEEYKGL